MLLGGFCVLRVSECTANTAHLRVIPDPVSGGLGKACRCVERNDGCKPMPFIAWLEWMPLAGVLGCSWTLVFVPYIDSSCCPSFQRRYLVATLSSHELSTVLVDSGRHHRVPT